MISPSRRQHRAAGVLAAFATVLLLGAALPLRAQPASVAVLPPRSAALFESVDAGVQAWLADRIHAAGVDVVPRDASNAAAAAVVASSGGELAVLRGDDAPALATRLDATRFVFVELHYDAGTVDLRLRAHDPSGAIVTANQQLAPLAELGPRLQEATAQLLKGIGAVDAPARSVPAPGLGELGSYERAIDAIGGFRLVDGWTELAGLETPLADALRQELLETARAPEVSPAERSRLSSLRGVKDSDWLRVRQGLLSGDDAQMSLAGADAAVARGNPEQALSMYRDALQIDPTSPDAHLGRARMLEALDDHSQAARAYQQALDVMPDEPEVLEALARNPTLPADQQAQHWMQLGRVQSDRLDADAAGQAFRAAGQQDGGILARAQHNVAALNERMGRHGEALLSYEEAAALAKDDPDILAGLGRARSASGDRGGAHAAYDAALTASPNHAGALLGKGQALLDDEKPDAAVMMLDRAVAAAPADTRARRTLARAHQQNGDPDAALALLDPTSFPAPERAGVWSDVAQVHAAAGRLPEARAALEQAIAIEPEDPPLRDALAGIYEKEGNAPAAQAQRVAAAGLVGTRIEPTDRTQAGVLPSGGGAAAPEWVGPMVASFPLRSPETGRPVGPTLFVGVMEPLDWKGQAREWLLPWTTDLERVDRQLIEGLIERYELVAPPEVPATTAAALERIRDFSTDRGDIAMVNDTLGVDAVFVAQIARPIDRFEPDAPLQIELRMLGGRSGGDVFILASQKVLADGQPLTTWNLRAALPWGTLLVLVLAPILRGWGRVDITLDYETRKDSEGFFSIELRRKPGKAKREKAKKASGTRAKKQKYQRKVGGFRRFARSMVGRETRFRLVPARTWYVVVHGLMQDKTSGEVIGNYLEERQIEVVRGKTTEVAFDLRPKEATLEVKLQRPEEQAGSQVTVALRGRADTLRYVKEDTTIYPVGNGEQVVVVGVDDRVYEQQVLISDLNGAVLSFQTTGPDPIFEGCAEAVEPYLNGDLEAASRILDRAGLTDTANWIRAEFHKERGESGEAARFYEAAGHLTMAAELSSDAAQPDQSATLFEQAGEFGKAAEAYAQAGDALKAAQAFEAAYDYESAIDAYRQAGDDEKTMELLEKTGGYYEAAAIALQSGDTERGIRNLQMVDLRDPDYAEACRSLAEIFADRDEWSLALEKAREAIQVAGDEAAPLELHEKLGDLLERAGRLDEAIEVFESIRKRDYQYPGMKERVAALRSQVDSAATVAATDSNAATVAAGAGASGANASEEQRYEILEELGRGGMGIVHKARDRRLGRVVALKQLPENLREHPTAVQLFLREARSAAALNHQNIVTLFDADQTDDGNYYITMECLEGFPLDKILQKRGKLSAKDTLRLAVQISTGLQYAHERGIVHRDIKTSNLFFTREKVVKIMDFGLAKMMEEVRRAATVIGGTPYYMAPEQAAGESVDHRADLYAFGVTLFELLAGRVPFTEGDVTYQHRHEPAPDVRTLAPETPAPVAELVLQLMAKTPDERPATTAEVTAALESLLQQA